MSPETNLNTENATTVSGVRKRFKLWRVTSPTTGKTVRTFTSQRDVNSYRDMIARKPKAATGNARAAIARAEQQ